MRRGNILLGFALAFTSFCFPNARAAADASIVSGEWKFSNGSEFPGAQGSMEVDKKDVLHLRFDFTGGGNYVGVYRNLTTPASLKTVSFRAKKPKKGTFTVRVTDSSDQCFQKSTSYEGDDWRTLCFDMNNWTGQWGGPDDGILRQPVKSIGILVESSSLAEPTGEVLIADLAAEATSGPPAPVLSAGMYDGQYVATDFGNDSGFSCGAHGSLENNVWSADLASVESVSLHHSLSLFGKPREFALKVRGGEPGNIVRVTIGSHFQSFDRAVGVLNGTDQTLTFSPPPEGWTHSGAAEDDISYPIRILALTVERGSAPPKAVRIEMAGLWCATTVPRAEPVTLLARMVGANEQGNRRMLKAQCLAWNLLGDNLTGRVFTIARDWQGKEIKKDESIRTFPANGLRNEVLWEAAVPVSLNFAEIEFRFEAEGVKPAVSLATYTKPLDTKGDIALRPESPWGMGVYLYRYGSPEEMDKAASAAAAAGVKWSREEFSWAGIEPTQGQYSFDFYDNVVNTANRHGISVYGLLSYWSNWTQAYTEEGIDDFCVWARAVVRHFKDRVKHWEIYNEPNIFFWNGPKELYPVLMERCYAAIKVEDPKATVLAISTAGIDRKFIRQCLDAKAPFDILTIHPYRSKLIDRGFMQELRETAELVGGRPVWITEMGWPTHVDGVDQRTQAQMLARSYLSAIASGACQNISWYDFRNDGNDPFYNESNFGVLYSDMAPKPAYRALASVCRLLPSGKPRLLDDFGKDVLVLEMGKSLAVWAPAKEATLKFSAGKGTFRIINLMGEELNPPRDGKEYILNLQPGSPVFLTGAKVTKMKRIDRETQGKEDKDLVRF